MNFEYRKIFHRNYLIITDYNIEDYEECYRSKMLKSNTLEQFLTYDTRNINGKIQFTYDISSKQSLYSFYESTYIDYEMLRHIILSLKTIFDQLNHYLLEPDFILLHPECIYMNIATKTLYYCYCPGEKNNFYDALSEFLNYLLGKINHEDQNSIVLAYSLQQCSLNPNYTIYDLMEILEKPVFTHETISEDITEKEPEFSFEPPAEKTEEFPPLPSPEKKTDKEKYLYPIAICCSFFLFGIGFLFHLKGIPLLFIGLIPLIAATFFSLSKKEDGIPLPNDFALPDDFTIQPADYHTPFSEEQILSESTYSEDTVILGYRTTEHLPRLIYTGTDFSSETEMNSFPFCIGKLTEKVQMTIDNPMISRIHARIHLKENIYYIEDMNSSNGTYLNQELLQPHALTELHPGDFITFSHLTYLFQ